MLITPPGHVHASLINYSTNIIKVFTHLIYVHKCNVHRNLLIVMVGSWKI